MDNNEWIYILKVFSSKTYKDVEDKKKELKNYLRSKELNDPIVIYIGTGGYYVLGIGNFKSVSKAAIYAATYLMPDYKSIIIEKPKAIAFKPN
ncbi:MAG: hypothetical protein KBT06_05525 [Prevotellaceae bacterium]|nr:hypothetical protein [Candidatus Colivivens equi]